jgi:hypothetical protein
MLTPEERATVAQSTRLMQIIVLALVAGVGAYLTFAVMNREADNDQPLAPMGAAFAAASFAGAVIVPTTMAGQQRRAVADGATTSTGNPATASEAGQLLVGLQTRKIVATALLEGAAFFNIFIYHSGGPTYSLAICIALLLMMISHIPLRPLVENWLERELRTVRELRQLKG